MDKLLITGGQTLHGEVVISGAKNAALPELCAALLTADPVVLHNVPHLHDVLTMQKLVRNMGVQAERMPDDTVHLQAPDSLKAEAPYELVKTMRASILALGPLLAALVMPGCRCPVAVPSGRGLWISTSKDWWRWVRSSVWSMATSKLRCLRGKPGSRAHALPPTWSRLPGTENFLMAAALAEGETVLENAAQRA